MVSRRSSGVIRIQPATSSPVLPQPMQKPESGSITQIWTQGVSMAVSGQVLKEKVRTARKTTSAACWAAPMTSPV